jgi:hypothetical protein
MRTLFVLAALVLFTGCVSLSEVLPFASEHVLFMTTAASFYALGRFFKFMAPAPEKGRFWRLFRQTLPWHPVFAGVFLGLFCPGICPASVGTGRIACALYFAGAGVLATYGHDVFRTWEKYRS